MPDQVLRYRLELDQAGFMSQLSSVESQAGGQIYQMVQPIISATTQAYQAGVNALTGTQAAISRIQSGGGGFFAQNLASAGIPRQGLFGTLSSAMGTSPMRDYSYTPQEAQYLYGRDFTRRVEGVGMGLGRAALETGGEFLGSSVGGGIGAAVGRGLAGWPGGLVGWLGGEMVGARMGQAAYGPVGGAAIGGLAGRALAGAMGLGSLSGLGALAGSAAGTILGTGAQGIMETVAQRRQLQPMIDEIGGRAAPFPYSQNPLGSGYSPTQSGQIADSIMRMSANDFRYNVGDYQKVIQAGMQTGVYDTASTTQKFDQTTKDLIENVKLIQTSFRKTLDESIPVLQQMIGSGVHNRDQVRQLVSQVRGSALVSGVSPDELLQAGQLATASAKGTFFDSTSIRQGVATASSARMARQAGAIRDPFGRDVTLETFQASGGESQVAANTQRAMSDFFQSQTGQDIVLSGYDPSTRHLQPAAFQSFLQGKTGIADVMRQAAGKGTNLDTLNKFRYDYPRLQDEMTPGQQAQLIMRSLQEEAKYYPGGNTREGLENIFAEKMGALGYKQLDARAIFADLRTMPAEETLRQEAEASRGVASGMSDRDRELGLSGAWRRAKKAIGGTLTNMGADLTERFYDPVAQATQNFYNEHILGISGNRPAGDMSSNALMPWLEDQFPKILGQRNSTLPDVFRHRLSLNEAGELPGYGMVGFQTDDGPRGIKIRDTNFWGGPSQVFLGSLADFQKGEQENARLAQVLRPEALASVFNAEYPQTHPWASEVSKRMDQAAGLTEYLHQEKFAKGGAPSFTSLVYGTGNLLKFTDKQLEDKDLRDEIGRQTAGQLSPATLESIKSSVLDQVPGTDMGAGEAYRQASDSRKRIENVIGTDVDFQANESAILDMTKVLAGGKKVSREDLLAVVKGKKTAGVIEAAAKLARYSVSDPKGAAALSQGITDIQRGHQQVLVDAVMGGVRLDEKAGKGDKTYDSLELEARKGFGAMAHEISAIGDSPDRMKEVEGTSLGNLARVVHQVQGMHASGAGIGAMADILRTNSRNGPGGILPKGALELATQIQSGNLSSEDISRAVVGAWGERRSPGSAKSAGASGAKASLATTFEKAFEQLGDVLSRVTEELGKLKSKS